MFKHGNIDDAVTFGDADSLAKIANRRRSKTSAPKPAQSRHTRIVPATNVIFFDELAEFSFAGNGVGQVEAREFNLTRARVRVEA